MGTLTRVRPEWNPGSRPCLQAGFRPGFATRLYHNHIISVKRWRKTDKRGLSARQGCFCRYGARKGANVQCRGQLGTVVYQTIANELARHVFQRTLVQCRQKIEALKKRYNSIADRMRQSGAGRESDESDLPETEAEKKRNHRHSRRYYRT